MEDAHAAVLDLDGTGDKSNTFFAVYDGHGGKSSLFIVPDYSSFLFPGATVARFAGQHVHKRLVAEESYKAGNYPEALKKAFLGTDEDLLASAYPLPLRFPLSNLTDPAHTRDPSGCTAVAALITHDDKIYVVCSIPTSLNVSLTPYRLMLATHDQ
jgi:protein phosphatase 2C family protein 2/3